MSRRYCVDLIRASTGRIYALTQVEADSAASAMVQAAMVCNTAPMCAWSGRDWQAIRAVETKPTGAPYA